MAARYPLAMPSGSVTRLVVWLGLLLAGVFFFSAGGSYGGIEYVPARIASQILAYAILGLWLVVALLRPEWRPSTPLVLPVLVVMGAYALATLLSQRSRLSFEPFTAGLGWAIAFLFLGRILADPWFRSRVRVVLTVLPVLVAVAYIVEVIVRWIQWWSLVGGFAIPPLRPGWAGLIYGSPNIVGTILLLTAPLGAVLLAQRFGRWWPSGLSLGLVAVAIFLTGSRGAWLGAVMAAVVGAVIVIAWNSPRTGRPDCSSQAHTPAGRDHRSHCRRGCVRASDTCGSPAPPRRGNNASRRSVAVGSDDLRRAPGYRRWPRHVGATQGGGKPAWCPESRSSSTPTTCTSKQRPSSA